MSWPLSDTSAYTLQAADSAQGYHLFIKKCLNFVWFSKSNKIHDTAVLPAISELMQAH